VTIIVFIFSFIAGILIASFVSLPLSLGVFLVFIGLAVIFIEKFRSASIGREVLFLALVLIGLGLGVGRYEIKDYHVEKVPSGEGIVISEPEKRENSTRFILKTDNGEKVLVSTDLYSEVKYGDKVLVSGKLEKPGVIEGDDGRDFDYGKYLSKDDIYYTMSFTQLEVVESGLGHPVKSFLLEVKGVFVEKIRDILAEPESSLLAGLIVSGKDTLSKDILEEFRRAGIVHIVVLSGFNITIIAESIRRFFGQVLLKLRVLRADMFASILSILGIAFFVLMTGGEATVVRAAIMVLVVLGAKMTRLKYSASRALLLAAFIMLVFNPKILTLDASFQLSFLATLALIYVVPVFERHLSFLTDKFGLKGIVATTLGTQVLVLPYLIYAMGNASLVFLPANILTLVVIPATMLVGFLATIVAFISTTIALPLTYMAHLLLSWILWVSHFLGNLSFSSINTPPIPWWCVVFVYVFLLFIFGRRRSSLLHLSS
jgi:competence protein ComEC